MKITMFLTDYMSYKTYLDLKNYLSNNKYISNIELDYYYFNYTCSHLYKPQILPYLFYPTNDIATHVENMTSEQHNGFVIQYTMFAESFMLMLRNFINNKDDLLNIKEDNSIFPNILEWFNQFNNSVERNSFDSEIEKIAKADIYLISSRLGFKNFATMTIETALALYLIRKYNSKVFIGGGSVNEPDNPIVNLINAVGREYTDGKLEYLVGTIGINIFNYLKGYEYQNKRSLIERNVLPLNFTENELTNYFNNSFAIELIRGCTQCCPYCCNSVINKYDTIDISNYDSWFAYFNSYFPSAHLYFYAPEINTNKEYFDRVLDYLITNKICNPLSFYINIIKITDKQIDKLAQLNIHTLSCALDLLFDDVAYKQYNIGNILDKLDKLVQLCNSRNTTLYAYIVANVPKYVGVDYSRYKDIFTKYQNIIQYSDFVLFISTDIAKNPHKYGLKYSYYTNRYKELSSIDKVISNIPIMYFREDIDRKQLLLKKYAILQHMIKDIAYDVMLGFKNKFFLQLLIEQVLPDIDVIDKHNRVLDKLILKYKKENEQHI